MMILNAIRLTCLSTIVGRCANYTPVVVIELTIGYWVDTHGLLLARFMSMHCWHAFNKRLGQQTCAGSSTYKLNV